MSQSMPLEEDLQPPMANGEVTFQEPWQGRVFGIARVLAEQGLYSWDEFRVQLIASIGAWDRHTDSTETEPGADYRYYDHFLVALQSVLREKKILSPELLEGRFKELLNRPHDHDHHRHDHHHPDPH
jgi:nitrile hydratase accessory protein